MAGRPQQLVPLKSQSLTFSSNYSEEVGGGFFSRLLLPVEGTLTLSGDPNMPGEGCMEWLGDVRITQNGTALFSARALDLYHVARTLGAASPALVTSSAATVIRQAIDLDFAALVPGAGFDATGKNRVGLRLDTGAIASYTNTSLTYSSGGLNVKPQLEHYGGMVTGQEIIAPRWQHDIVPMITESSQTIVRKTFDQRGVLFGCSFRTYDASATSESSGRRVDTMLRRVKGRLTPNVGGFEELFDFSWSQLRANTAKQFRVPQEQDTPGFAMYRFIDPRARAANFGLPIEPGDSIEFHLDNASAIESSYGSAITPATGDYAALTWLFFQGDPAGAAQPQRGSNVVANAGALRTGGTRRR
jgi:hypothetical protein